MVDSKSFNRRKLTDLVRKVNEVLTDIKTINITETNNVINAISTFVENLRSRSNKQKEREELWWMRRIHQSTDEIKNYIKILERNKEMRK